MSFEKHTRRKIKNHPSEVDTDALWNSIKNDIPQEKDRKKRGIFFLFFGFAITGSVIALSYHLILEKDMLSSAIAFHQESSSSEQRQNLNDYLSNTVITRIPNENHSKSDTKIVSVQPEYSTSILGEKEILCNNNQSYEQLVDDNVSNIPFDDSKIVTYIKSTKEVKKEVLSLVVKEKEGYSLLAENIPNAKNIPVVQQEIDEELIQKIELQEEELEEEKKESKEKKPKEKSNYSLFVHTDVSSSIKGKTASTHNVQGVRSAKETFNLKSLHIGISKNFGNKILVSSDISYAVLSEKVLFKSAKSDIGTMVFSPKTDTSSPSASSHAEIKESSFVATNVSDANIGSIGSGNTINLETINKTKILGLSFSMAYKQTFKNEKVFLLLGAGSRINIRTASTGYIRTSGFNNRASNSFIAEQNALDKKELTISPILSASFNFELNSKAHLILGMQYQVNPNLFGASAGVRFQLSSK